MRLALLAIFTGSLFFAFQQGWLSHGGVSWHSIPAGKNAGAETTMLEGRMLTSVLAARQRAGVPPVLPDPDLQEWLLKCMESGPADAGSISQRARSDWPQFQELVVLQSHSATGEGLVQQIASSPHMGGRELTQFAAVTQSGVFGLGWSATVLAGLRLPLFSPEALADAKQEKFYNVCALCGEGQACVIPRHTHSISLECPHCRHVYAMLAADSQGRFRYVNEYLMGYAPPAHFPRAQTKLEELMTIWRAVAGGCRYTMDEGDDANDTWQTAQETQTLGTGDCEDSSILLADWLLARNFQVRVALGRYAERGAHAWVVVRLEGQDYLLESTEGASAAKRPPLLAEVGSRYVPELLFDQTAIYTRKRTGEMWSGDFWDEGTWQRIVPRPRYPSDGNTVTQLDPR